MDQWTDGKTDQQMDGLMDQWINLINILKEGGRERWRERRRRHIDGWTNRQKKGQKGWKKEGGSLLDIYSCTHLWNILDERYTNFYIWKVIQICQPCDFFEQCHHQSHCCKQPCTRQQYLRNEWHFLITTLKENKTTCTIMFS